jgi:hypothetical protein
MAKNKKPADAAKDKAAKQKKIAIGLVCLLALAVAYAVHTMTALNSGSSASKPQAVDPATATSTTPAATPAPTASPTSAAPSLSGAPLAAADPTATAAAEGTAAAGSTQLVSAVSPPPDAGQLESFSRFDSRDPFAGATGSGSASGGGSSGSGSSGSSPASPPLVPPAPPTPPPSSAVISVNGLSEQVSTSGIFPVSSPNATSNGLFELISLTAKTATISVVGGSYAGGSQTLTLKVNTPVTLVNTADGTRYTLQLYPQGTAAPSGATSGASGATGATTTPTPTTTTPSSGG